MLLQSRLEGKTLEVKDIAAAAAANAVPNGHQDNTSDSSATEDLGPDGVAAWRSATGPWWEAAEQRFSPEQVGAACHFGCYLPVLDHSKLPILSERK